MKGYKDGNNNNNKNNNNNGHNIDEPPPHTHTHILIISTKTTESTPHKRKQTKIPQVTNRQQLIVNNTKHIIILGFKASQNSHDRYSLKF